MEHTHTHTHTNKTPRSHQIPDRGTYFSNQAAWFFIAEYRFRWCSPSCFKNSETNNASQMFSLTDNWFFRFKHFRFIFYLHFSYILLIRTIQCLIKTHHAPFGHQREWRMPTRQGANALFEEHGQRQGAFRPLRESWQLETSKHFSWTLMK